MATILFDNMRAARRLEGEGNSTRQQAETLSEVMHDSLTEGVATKTDIDALGADLKATETVMKADTGALRAEMGTLRAEMGTLRAELKADIASVRTEISDGKTQIIVWVTGVMLTLLVASGLMQHFLR